MAQEYLNPRRWDPGKVLAGLLCLALPIAGGIVHELLQIGTNTQLAYYLVGISAALMCSLTTDPIPAWGKLLAAEAFIAIAFLPRLIFPMFTGVVDISVQGAIVMAVVPGIFVVAHFVIHRRLSQWDAPPVRRFTWAMCLAAFGMHAFLLPILLGEPLADRIIHTAEPAEEIIATNPSGSLVLTHSALAPVTATLYAHQNNQLEIIHQTPLDGYPVGIRIRDDHALIALRIQDEEKVVVRIDFVRLSETGIETVGSYPCESTENPSHIVNNLSPDGALLVLADGAFVDVTTGTRVEGLPPDANPDRGLTFVQWTEAEGHAAFYHEKDRRLVLLAPSTGKADSHALRGHPRSAHALSVLPGRQAVWYEEAYIFNWQHAFVENLADRTRTKLSRKRGRTMDGTELLWTGKNHLSYITVTGALKSLSIDFERNRYVETRHSQLFEMTGWAAVAPESGWLFWVTPAPHHDDGIAIHRERMPTVP